MSDPIVRVAGLTKVFKSYRRKEGLEGGPEVPRRAHRDRDRGGRRRDLLDRPGRDGRLHRRQRRRQVHDDQDADRHPDADLGRGRLQRLRARTASAPATSRRSASSSASARSSGGTSRSIESFRLLKEIYGLTRRPQYRERMDALRQGARPERLPPPARPQALARRADALRPRGLAAAPAAAALPRRADDRPRHRGQGQRAGVPPGDQPAATARRCC